MKPNRTRYQKIISLVDRLMETHNVRTIPVDIFSIALEYSFVIKTNDIDDVSIIMRREKSGATIVLNNREALIRHRFSVAHALGHHILHPYIEEHVDRQFVVLGRNRQLTFDRNIQEKEANFFASRILIPQWGLEEKIVGCPLDEFGEIDVRHLAKEFVVSSNLMLIRLCGMEGHLNAFSTFPRSTSDL